MSDEEIIETIKSGDSARVISLLHNGMNVNSNLFAVDSDDEDATNKTTALVVAAHNNHTGIVDILLDAGASINARNMVEQTACHIAAENGHIEPLKLLIARGADIEIPDCESSTPLDVTAEREHADCAVALIEAGAALTHVHTVCQLASLNCNTIQALLDRGVKLSELRDGNNWYDGTPCHLAARKPVRTDGAPIRMLIANGVDVDARDEIGATCLHYLATALGDGLESALRAGADVNARDNNNMTPLHYAMVKQQSYSSVFVNAVILLFFGADIHAADNDGTTICHAATKWVTHVYDLQVRLLLPALLLLGADFDAPNNNGVTPRMLASEPTKADFDIMRKFFVGIVRRRAFQVCLGLQSLRINALQTCEILMQACGPFAVAVPFHAWWKIATTVKHFHAAQQPANSKSKRDE